MNPTDEKGEISNEFFKKLNQQIVQKDNLIKLLQLQIRNLKSQLEEDGGDKDEVAKLESELSEKIADVERLKEELAKSTEQSELISKEKDEQIEALNKLINEQEKADTSEVEVVEDPRVPELESKLVALTEELELAKSTTTDLDNTKSELDAAKSQIAALTEELESTKKAVDELEALREENQILKESKDTQGSDDEIQELRIAIEASKVEIENLKSELDNEKIKVIELSSNNDSSKIQELEQDIQTLKNLLAEKDEEIASLSETPLQTEDNENLLSEIDTLKSELNTLKNQPKLTEELEAELNKLREENSLLEPLKDEIAKLKEENSSVTELAMKVTALEEERKQLQVKLEQIDTSAFEQQIEDLNKELELKGQELAKARVAAESNMDQSISDPLIREEVDQLTQQVADQLLAIQNFEGMLNEAKKQLKEKDDLIKSLEDKQANANNEPVINISGESEIITSFIDFFDGLDSILTKNPIPELQLLHQRLMDRLIIPNQISYVPVISEEFNPDYHIATDYFRSQKFDEKCIVFEVEKGYRKGDLVVKKSKVWVVQNLYQCTECDAMQSNSDSRFCHLCGAKIIAPNGLPVDSLPEFDPTPTTYLRFAERMLEKENIEKAKSYLEEGLRLDPNFVPLMIMLGQIHAANSNFEAAIEILSKACTMKPDPKIEKKIKDMELKLNIFNQAKNLGLAPDKFEDLVHIIQK